MGCITLGICGGEAGGGRAAPSGGVRTARSLLPAATLQDPHPGGELCADPRRFLKGRPMEGGWTPTPPPGASRVGIPPLPSRYPCDHRPKPIAQAVSLHPTEGGWPWERGASTFPCSAPPHHQPPPRTRPGPLHHAYPASFIYLLFF